MIGRRLPKNRTFHYEPRYWDPVKEEREGRNITFKRHTSKKAAKQRSMIWLFMLIIIVLFLVNYFSKLGK